MSRFDDFTLNVEYQSEGLEFIGIETDEDTGQVIALWQRLEQEKQEDLEYQFVDPPFPYTHITPGSFPGIVECKAPDYCLICDQFEEPPEEAPLEPCLAGPDCPICREALR